MRAWTKRWSDLSIRYKLFAVFLFVVSVPFALLLSIHLSMTAKESKQQATVSAHKVMEETKAYLEYKAVSIHEVLNFIAFNDVIQEAASNPEPYTDVNLWGRTRTGSLKCCINFATIRT